MAKIDKNKINPVYARSAEYMEGMKKSEKDKSEVLVKRPRSEMNPFLASIKKVNDDATRQTNAQERAKKAKESAEAKKAKAEKAAEAKKARENEVRVTFTIKKPIIKDGRLQMAEKTTKNKEGVEKTVEVVAVETNKKVVVLPKIDEDQFKELVKKLQKEKDEILVLSKKTKKIVDDKGNEQKVTKFLGEISPEKYRDILEDNAKKMTRLTLLKKGKDKNGKVVYFGASYADFVKSQTDYVAKPKKSK